MIDAHNIFISNGKICRWQPGEPYGATGAGLAEVLNDAIAGRPFFVNGSLVTHSTIIASYVSELVEFAKQGLLRRAVDAGSDETPSARFHRVIDLEGRRT